MMFINAFTVLLLSLFTEASLLFVYSNSLARFAAVRGDSRVMIVDLPYGLNSSEAFICEPECVPSWSRRLQPPGTSLWRGKRVVITTLIYALICSTLGIWWALFLSFNSGVLHAILFTGSNFECSASSAFFVFCMYGTRSLRKASRYLSVRPSELYFLSYLIFYPYYSHLAYQDTFCFLLSRQHSWVIDSIVICKTSCCS